jgi:AcrR family transcriptional regulator
MVRNADQTRRRLIEAATAELAAVGVAGARVDRIANSAGSNKAMIYAYFGGKENLANAVFAANAAAFLDQEPFDATDLTGYVGRLFDFYKDNPTVLRLSTWAWLETDGRARSDSVTEATRSKLEDLDRAQRDGVLSSRYTPVELLALVLAISQAWSYGSRGLGDAVRPSLERQRLVLVEAMRSLLAQK